MSAAERVAAGVALLDEKLPGWEKSVRISWEGPHGNEKRFDIRDPKCCILGQLGDRLGYLDTLLTSWGLRCRDVGATGWGVMLDHAVLGIGFRDAGEYGFYPNGDSDAVDAEQAAWLTVLRERGCEDSFPEEGEPE